MFSSLVKITSKFKIQNRERTKENTEKVVLQKNKQKLQTYKSVLNKMITSTHIMRNIQFCSSFKRNMLKYTCKAAKIKVMKNS